MITRNNHTVARCMSRESHAEVDFNLDLPSWFSSATCASVDPDAFFPERGQGGGRTHSRAKAICGSCPVRIKCLDYALDNDEDFGIWGGLTVRERRSLKRRALT